MSFLTLFPIHWTKNPLKENETANVNQALGFELVYPKTDQAPAKFGGLVITTISDENYISSLLNGNPGTGAWFFAIGMYQSGKPSWVKKGIPAIESSTTCVSLWLLLPGQTTCYIKIPKIYPHIFITVFFLLI